MGTLGRLAAVLRVGALDHVEIGDASDGFWRPFWSSLRSTMDLFVVGIATIGVGDRSQAPSSQVASSVPEPRARLYSFAAKLACPRPLVPVMVKGPSGLGSKCRLADMGWPVVAWVGGKVGK